PRFPTPIDRRLSMSEPRVNLESTVDVPVSLRLERGAGGGTLTGERQSDGIGGEGRRERNRDRTVVSPLQSWATRIFTGGLSHAVRGATLPPEPAAPSRSPSACGRQSPLCDSNGPGPGAIGRRDPIPATNLSDRRCVVVVALP